YLGDVQTELEAGATPGHPHDTVTEALTGEAFSVHGGGQGDSRVRVQVVHVCCADQTMHGGVDGRGGATLAEQAVVEGGDHRVLAFLTGIDVHEGAQTVQAQNGQAVLGEGTQVTTGTLDPQHFDGLPGDGVDAGSFCGGVASGEVGVTRVGAECVTTCDELCD